MVAELEGVWPTKARCSNMTVLQRVPAGRPNVHAATECLDRTPWKGWFCGRQTCSGAAALPAELGQSELPSAETLTAANAAFVADGSAVAFLVKAGALLMARNGVTVRPLAQPDLRLKTYLVSRADNESKLASELVRAFMRKISDVNKYKQLSLRISA